MQLDIEKTKIDVEERSVYAEDLCAPVGRVISVTFVATLNGESVEGHTIHMSREATSPDVAIKELFNAMTAAGVTL